MVRRRSTVRFRNGAPAQRAISNVAVQDPVTKFHDPVTNIAADLAGQTDVAGQKAASGLRLSPGQTLPVSVARRIRNVISDGRRIAAYHQLRSCSCETSRGRTLCRMAVGGHDRGRGARRCPRGHGSPPGFRAGHRRNGAARRRRHGRGHVVSARGNSLWHTGFQSVPDLPDLLIAEKKRLQLR
jgi:hypothetical protein